MSALSNYAENELLDHVLGTAAYTAPTNIYVKLHLGDPGEDGTANPAVNTTRVSTGAMSVAVAGSSDNDAAISWTNVSTTETYSHISIWDDLTAGNCLFVGALSSNAVMTAGDDFEIPAGSLTITFS